MGQLMKLDKEYAQWIAELAQRYRSSQIKAGLKVNDEMLRFYWSVGEDIEKRQYENRYGSHFYENVSKDLRGILNLNRGMSATTIKYTCYFYRLYSQLFENRQGVIDDFDCIFRIPWSLHVLIIDKLKKEPHKALFYERQGAAQTNFALTIPAPESDLAQELLKRSRRA